MAIISKSTNKYWQGREEVGTLVHCWWECRLVQPPWKAVRRYLKKLKMKLPLLGKQPKKTKTLIWKNISTPKFIAVLFPIAKIWKRPKCPSIDEWMKQLWDIYIMEYYLAIKKKDFTLCNSMDGPGEHYTKWNKTVRERKIPNYFTHMWNLMNKLNKENWDRLIDGEQDDS